MKRSALVFGASIWVGATALTAYAEAAPKHTAPVAADPLEDPYLISSDLPAPIGFVTNAERTAPDNRFQLQTQILSSDRGESNQTSLSVRLDQLDQRNGTQRRGWYVFAGADDEALTFSGLTGSDIELRDHVTIGDVHVGLSFPMGVGQAALGYSRRSVEYETKTLSATVDEDILGLSYGLKF